NVLPDRIGVSDAVPLFRKEVPQADADQSMPLRQRSQYAAPDAEIAERAMHADQRWPLAGLAHVEIGHVVSVDVEGLHTDSREVLQGTPVQDSRKPGGSQLFPSLDFTSKRAWGLRQGSKP